MPYQPKVDYRDRLNARKIMGLGAPVGHPIAPCACRRGTPRNCTVTHRCEDLVDAIAAAIVAQEYDDEIPF